MRVCVRVEACPGQLEARPAHRSDGKLIYSPNGGMQSKEVTSPLRAPGMACTHPRAALKEGRDRAAPGSSCLQRAWPGSLESLCLGRA